MSQYYSIFNSLSPNLTFSSLVSLKVQHTTMNATRFQQRSFKVIYGQMYRMNNRPSLGLLWTL